MPYSYAVTTASGSTPNVAVPFGYIAKADVHVSLDGVMVADNTLTWLTSSSIQLNATPAAGVVVKVYRLTDITDLLVSFSAPAIDDPNDLNLAFTQLLYVTQEASDANTLTASDLSTIVDYVNSVMAAAADSATAAAASAASIVGDQAAAAASASAAAASAAAAAAVVVALGSIVLNTRQVLASGIATGGGDLSADRTITVTKAAGTDVVTGTDDAKAVTSKALADAQLFPGIPLTSVIAAKTFVLADANKGFLHPSADTTARTWTIPANSSVAYPLGTCLTMLNQHSGGVITVAITTDTMRIAGAGTTGSRSLAADGVATATKIATTEWLIAGTGLT